MVFLEATDLVHYLLSRGLVSRERVVEGDFVIIDGPTAAPLASPRMDDFAPRPLHVHCLFHLGCYLGEMFYLTPLADWLRANGRNCAAQ
jgi:hypothetical protein